MKKQHFSQVAIACMMAAQQYIMQMLRHGDGFVSQVQQFPIYEGRNTLYMQIGTSEIGQLKEMLHEGGSEEVSNLSEVSGQGYIKTEDIRAVRLEAFSEMLFNIAKGLEEGRGRAFYSELNTILDRAGRTFSARGEPFSFEILLETLEKTEIAFDELGKPIWPALVVPPSLAPVVARVFRDAATDTRKDQALRELLHRKREAFNAKEANRKLVD